MANELTFVIALEPTSEGGAYRIYNKEGEVNRPHILEQGKTHLVQADLVHVLHGALNADGDAATLIVTDFRFMPGSGARRFKNATITYVFSGGDSRAGLIGPDVIDIAPRGHFSLGRTSRQVELGHNVNLSVKTAAAVPVGPELGYAMDLKQQYSEADQTTLEGSVRYQGREMGGKNVAQWVLSENSTARSGIPTDLRTAILLQRPVEEELDKFEATVEVKVEAADWKSTLSGLINGLMGRIPKDDPIRFDPAVSTKGAASIYDGENLQGVKLGGIMRVATTKWIDDGDKPEAEIDAKE